MFNAAGVACVNVCNGMAEIHTAEEHIAVADLEAMTGGHPPPDRTSHGASRPDDGRTIARSCPIPPNG